MTPETELFKHGMRRLAAGVSIVTTHDAHARHGMVATSVCSVSADPPALLVCVNRSASCHAAIRTAGFFCVNLLASTDAALARRFSTPIDRDSRFEGRDWTTLATGAPALVGALASFDCEIREALDVESHTIFVGRVKAIELRRGDINPLVYVDGRFDHLEGCQVKDACA